MSNAELMGRLFYIAVTVLNLTIEEYGLCTEGEILTLYNIHRIVNGLAKKKHDTTIDDIIPF